MQPRLYYCDTNYDVSPAQDLNPLLPQLYQGRALLALCAREQQVIRLQKLVESNLYGTCKVVALGWWELEAAGKITDYNAVVIIGKNRIHPLFWHALEKVKDVCSHSQ